jgi:hypothetical protein
MGKYFTSSCKPSITASKQHSGAFSAGHVLFDWTELEIPKGTSCIRSVTMLTRPKGDAGPTANQFVLSLVFSSTNTTSLGTIRSSPDNRPNYDILGTLEFDAANYARSSMISTSVATAGGGTGDTESAFPPLVVTADPTTGTNVGFDKIYVGGIANGAWVWGQTVNQINDGDIDTSSPGTTLVLDGSGMDIREHFTAGDVLHAHDDAVIGTVASVTDANTLELTSAISTGVLEDDDYVYNLNPIKLIFGFEK